MGIEDLFGGDKLFGGGSKGTANPIDNALKGIEENGRLKRYFQTTQGQHKRKSDSPDNKDLVRLKSTGVGLPTIREDLAAKCDKIELKTTSGKGKMLLTHVIDKMTQRQKEDLKRHAPNR